MNDDLISRSAAIEKIKPYGTLNGSALGYHSGAVDCAIVEIERLPAVNAVEVVRCKDCKNYMTIHCPCDGFCTYDYWFCADGERKNNAADRC